MALRSFASSVLPRFGLRLQPFAYEISQSLERTFSSAVAPDVLYATSHEWVKVDGESATFGISDHAQGALGEIVYIELPEVGATVTKGEGFAIVESVKAASDVYAPVSGTVTEINSAVTEDPAKLNNEPYTSGWLVKIQVTGDASERADLLDAAAYTTLLDE